ncbi:MAG: pilus assembly protein TadG-related protein [Planctomycetota bacterium]|jgi:Flp pilus assembly protein TadG
MKKGLGLISRLKNERGATAIMVSILMVVFIGFTALSVDVGHICVVRNELQNAADAGALAGARFLYTSDGTAVNAGANTIAYNAAIANMSDGLAVEVNLGAGDVQRGHWSFATSTFTPNNSLLPVELFNKTAEELDADPNFINAVRQMVRRETTPVTLYFARIFGYQNSIKQAEAIAYIGFAGTLLPFEVDQPIAICQESILNGNGEYDCSIGRMINSGQNIDSNETGGWANLDTTNACQGGTNSNEVNSLVCSGGNPQPLTYGSDMGTNGGEIQSAFNSLKSCWESLHNGNLWELMLPVVTCPGNNVSPCETLVGAVTVNVVWITGAGEDPSYSNVPLNHAGWANADPDGQVRWADFVTHFNLQNVDGSSAPYAKKSIYFLPDCAPHEPTGGTGGANFGILAKIPVLVD